MGNIEFNLPNTLTISNRMEDFIIYLIPTSFMLIFVFALLMLIYRPFQAKHKRSKISFKKEPKKTEVKKHE